MSALILHGGKRSPFVRRVAIWLGLQGRTCERRAVDLFGADFEAFRARNPLARVPVLTTPDGDLLETSAIIDYLETTADEDARLIPASGAARITCLQQMGLANGIAEKGVAFVYETERRPAETQWSGWIERVTIQVDAGLAALEAACPSEGWFGGDRPNGADASAVSAIDFLITTRFPLDTASIPKLMVLSQRSRAHPAFETTRPDA
jgi:glutathione S-transferase